jgi:hypothetical protein
MLMSYIDIVIWKNMIDKIDKIKKVGNWLTAILLGNTRELIARIDERTNLMLDDLKVIKPKVDEMSPKVDLLWKDRLAPASSPRQLNERGNAILEKSGIKEIINLKKDTLLEKIREKEFKNAYDAEAAVLSTVLQLPNHCPDIIDKLKTGAFNTGASINDVLLVGGIYLRNIIFPDLGFKIEDLDKPMAKKQ